MARSKRKHTHRTPRATHGSQAAVDIVVGDKARHIGLVSIQNNGRDESGRVLGTNGIKWVTA